MIDKQSASRNLPVIGLGLLGGLFLWWIFRRPSGSRLLPPRSFDRTAAPRREAGPAKSDNLTAIEGIGPKVNQLLHDAGIANFTQLAGTRVSRLEQILNEAGLTMIKADTWPEQAKLAAAEEWDRLEKLQDQLKAGRRPD